MIFPIGDDNIIGGHKPIVSYALLVINSLIFIVFAIMILNGGEANVNEIYEEYAMVPFNIIHGHELSTLISHQFLHGGLLHIAGNMLFLWIFADNIEGVIGNIPFLIFYLAGGIVAAYAQIWFDPASSVHMVGASGAIAAVMGSYLILFPKSQIKVLVVIFRFYVPALIFLGLYFIIQIFSGLGTIPTESLSQVPASTEAGGDEIAWWSHIGGFIFGIILGLIFKQRFGDNYSYGNVNVI